MHKGNAFVSALISMVFIMGMLAPVPEYSFQIIGAVHWSKSGFQEFCAAG